MVCNCTKIIYRTVLKSPESSRVGVTFKNQKALPIFTALVVALSCGGHSCGASSASTSSSSLTSFTFLTLWGIVIMIMIINVIINFVYIFDIVGPCLPLLWLFLQIASQVASNKQQVSKRLKTKLTFSHVNNIATV